jgi:hypothetical protein
MIEAFHGSAGQIRFSWNPPPRDDPKKLGDVVEFLHFTKVLSYDRSLLCFGRPD